MTIRKFIYCIIACLVLSCSHSQKSNIIPREQMIHILCDLHIANALYEYPDLLKKDITLCDSIQYYDTIFKKYHCTRSQFDSSMAFYIDQQKSFESMYQEVYERLKDKEEALLKQKQTSSNE